MRRRVGRPRLGHVLGFGSALCLGLAAWPWLAPTATPPAAAKPAPAEPLAKIPDLPPLASFPAIIDRPLFSPSRRPAAAKPTPPAAAPETRYRLVGVVIVGDSRRAMLMEGTRGFEIREGDRLDQWLVQRVEPNRLVLTSPAGEAVLKLRQATAAPGAAPAAAKTSP